MIDYDTTAPTNDVFARYGLNIAKALLDQTLENRPEWTSAPSFYSSGAGTAIADHQYPRFIPKCTHDDAIPVGILGGGMAGLYTGLMLASVGIPFQILEATNRIGGRCYTYKFKEGGEWDFYVSYALTCTPFVGGH